MGNWLVRYTHRSLDSFTPYVLLTNFNNYVDLFCEQCGVEQVDYGANMRMAVADDITMINFGIGSPNAALIMDLLSAVQPSACLFLGKCGGISDKTHVGDYILPLAGIRGEGTSNDYFPPEIPALPACCKELFLPLCATHATTIGRVRFIQPTAACGNTTKNSRITCAQPGLWLWTWKRPRCFRAAFIIIYPLAHCCLCRTIL